MIKFGTSGWRGIIADEFTYSNVRLVSQAIAEYIKKENKDKKTSVVVGYDTRYMSEKFAKTAAEVLAGNGIKALLCDRDTPTPTIAFEILRRKSAGGINFTASHNPADYNGIKFSPSWGGPALPETTNLIEKYCNKLKPASIKTMNFDEAKKQRLIEEINPKPAYLKRIRELVNLSAIKKANIKIAVDVLYGTGNGYLDELLSKAGVRNKVIHNYRDVMFGGSAPEPNKANLKELISVMKKESCHLGLATDGDGDRFGIVDSDGTFITPNETIAVLLYSLAKNRKWTGVVARSVMTTHLIDRIADKFGLEVKETPVGFKYIGEILVNEGENFIIGGEESGGLTIRNHVPEKDGVLACLLMAETVAVSKKTVKKILAEIYKAVGRIYTDRLNFRLTHEDMDKFRENLKKGVQPKIAGFKLSDVVTIDGYKFLFKDGSWLGIRLSGTEPVVRLYVESDSLVKIKKLISAGKKLVNG